MVEDHRAVCQLRGNVGGQVIRRARTSNTNRL
jgi:hypothetical protein